MAFLLLGFCFGTGPLGLVWVPVVVLVAGVRLEAGFVLTGGIIRRYFRPSNTAFEILAMSEGFIDRIPPLEVDDSDPDADDVLERLVVEVVVGEGDLDDIT